MYGELSFLNLTTCSRWLLCVELCPLQKGQVDVLISGTSEGDSIWTQGLCRYNQLRRSDTRECGSLIGYDGRVKTGSGRRPREDRGLRGYLHKSRRVKDSQPKASEAGRSPLRASGELSHSDTLIATSSLQNRETHFRCFRYLVTGGSLRKPTAALTLNSCNQWGRSKWSPEHCDLQAFNDFPVQFLIMENIFKNMPSQLRNASKANNKGHTQNNR